MRSWPSTRVAAAAGWAPPAEAVVDSLPEAAAVVEPVPTAVPVVACCVLAPVAAPVPEVVLEVAAAPVPVAVPVAACCVLAPVPDDAAVAAAPVSAAVPVAACCVSVPVAAAVPADALVSVPAAGAAGALPVCVDSVEPPVDVCSDVVAAALLAVPLESAEAVGVLAVVVALDGGVAAPVVVAGACGCSAT